MNVFERVEKCAENMDQFRANMVRSPNINDDSKMLLPLFVTYVDTALSVI